MKSSKGIKKNKKGQYLWLFVVIALIGFIISLVIDAPLINYVVVVVSGFGLGAVLYEQREELKTHYIIAAIAFISGYVLGVTSASRWKVAAIFVIGIFFGYFIYKFFQNFRSEK